MLTVTGARQTAVEAPSVRAAAKGSVGVEETMAVVTLTDRGVIRECSQAVYKLFGCRPSKLVWKHVSLLLPELAEVTLMSGGEINPRLRFLSRIGYRFEVAIPGSASSAGKLFFNSIESSGLGFLRIIICPTKGERRHCDI